MRVEEERKQKPFTEEDECLLESLTVKPKNTGLSPFQISILFISLESIKALASESLFLSSRGLLMPSPISSSLLLFIVENSKFLVSLIAILHLGIAPSVSDTHLFIIPGLLYFINNYIYLFLLTFSSAAVVQFLNQMRIPLTAILHHFIIKKQPRFRPWFALLVLFIGIIITQLNERLEISNIATVLFCALASAISAFASIFNEKLLKFNSKSFWEQQLHVYTYGVGFSSISVIYSISQGHPLCNLALFTAPVVSKIILIVVSGTSGGILTGLLLKKIDNIAKLINGAVSNILVAVISILFLGLAYNRYFILGALLIILSSFAYGYFKMDKEEREVVWEKYWKIYIKNKWKVMMIFALFGVVVLFLLRAQEKYFD